MSSQSSLPKTTVRPGAVILDIRGLAGLVGAGRTELAQILFGLTPPWAGEIHLGGRPVTIASPSQAVGLGNANVPEDRRRYGVIGPLSVAANSTLAMLRKLATHGFLSFRREQKTAAELVNRLGIKTPSLTTPVEELSGGNQQKVALARCLAAEPSVVILDEPTQGIDVGARAEIHRLLGKLARQGLAILMISSDLAEILALSDRVAVMRAGTIVAILNGAEATQEKVLALALGSQ